MEQGVKTPKLCGRDAEERESEGERGEGEGSQVCVFVVVVVVEYVLIGKATATNWKIEPRILFESKLGQRNSIL